MSDASSSSSMWNMCSILTGVRHCSPVHNVISWIIAENIQNLSAEIVPLCFVSSEHLWPNNLIYANIRNLLCNSTKILRNSHGVTPTGALNTGVLYKFRNFRPIYGYMWNRHKIRPLLWNGRSNRKLYALYKTVTFPMTLSDL